MLATLAHFVNKAIISQNLNQGVHHGVTTTKLEELAAQTATSFSTQHPDYAVLAASMEVTNVHKKTKKKFSKESCVIIHIQRLGSRHGLRRLWRGSGLVGCVVERLPSGMG